MRHVLMVFAAGLLSLVFPLATVAQPETVAFQGALDDTQTPEGNGSYLMEFRLFDQPAGGIPIEVLTDIPVTVENRLFMVMLNFADPSAFDGNERYLETAVRRSSEDPFETLLQRQRITSAPYAIRSATASNADALQGLSIDGFVLNSTTQQPSVDFNIGGNGTLGGTLSANSASIGAGGLALNDAFLRLRSIADNTTGLIYSTGVSGLEFRALGGFVWRNGPSAATERMRLDAAGNLSAGGSINAGTQFNIGGQRFATGNGSLNTFVGIDSGNAATGQQNTFLGSRSGQSHLTGLRNTYVGDAAGSETTTSNENTFVGALAGLNARTIGPSVPAQNSFFGAGAGQNTTSGAGNTFVGFVAGNSNTTGNFNTAVGYNASFAFETLSNATAIGAGAIVSTSNTIVLGTPDERVVIAGLGSGRSALYVSNGGEIGISTSSLRYKTNVEPFLDGLSLVNELQPITFNWKDDDMPDLGLAAEDVAEIEPLLATYNDDGRVEGVKYDRLTVVLLNAVKQQQAQIEAQQSQLDEQRQLIEELNHYIRHGRTGDPPD